MDNQFNTLTRSYYDNYLEYKVTGNQAYQKAYTAAEEGIQNLLQKLQDKVDSQTSNISAFLKGNVQQKIKTMQDELKNIQGKYLTEQDQEVAAKMRLSVPTSVVSEPSYTNYYIAMGVLGAGVIGLMMMK